MTEIYLTEQSITFLVQFILSFVCAFYLLSIRQKSRPIWCLAMMQIDELIEESRAYDAAIADQLAILADEFDYGRILDLIQKAQQRSAL